MATFENNFLQQKNQKEELQKNVDGFLTLPERRDGGNPDKDLAKKLGSFLVNKGFIVDIGMWKGSWGCKYGNKKISINEYPMPEKEYEYYIFRLGVDAATGKQLFPENGDEADQYRFLHETGHAYQQYLINKESSDNPLMWYDRVLKEGEGKIKSTFGLLFEFCYKRRTANVNKGLSTWGNVPNYNCVQDPSSQNAVRAIEDANELVTMYLWPPQYLDAFLDYLSGPIPGYGKSSLHQDRLLKISEDEKEAIKLLIGEYIREMKIEMGKN